MSAQVQAWLKRDGWKIVLCGFALDETRPLACFAGIWTSWTWVRKVEEGETTHDLYAFLTTDPNAEVGAIHPKAMPVIVTTPEEVETWMTAPADEALKLQRPLLDGALRIVARGVKEDQRLFCLGFCTGPRKQVDKPEPLHFGIPDPC
ncbi:hypothetical protein ABID65_008117 [Bradyrhizobium sp. S3.9.2]